MGYGADAGVDESSTGKNLDFLLHTTQIVSVLRWVVLILGVETLSGSAIFNHSSQFSQSLVSPIDISPTAPTAVGAEVSTVRALRFGAESLL